MFYIRTVHTISVEIDESQLEEFKSFMNILGASFEIEETNTFSEYVPTLKLKWDE